MIKLYFAGVIGLLTAVWFGLDGYMTAQQLSWQSIGEVWPLWVLLMIVGFLLGGAGWGVIAQVAMSKESLALNKQVEANNEAYRNQLTDKQAELHQREISFGHTVKLMEQQLAEKEQQAKDKLKSEKRGAKKAMETATTIHVKAEQLILDTTAENESHKLSAFRATSTIKRLRRKIARLEQGNTTTQGA